MTPEPIAAIARSVSIAAPVLIAPHGINYHRPIGLFSAPGGAGAWVDAPSCGTYTETRWIAVDDVFAELLDRQPCVRCWPLPADPYGTIPLDEVDA